MLNKIDIMTEESILQPSRLQSSEDKIILQTAPAQQVLAGSNKEKGPVGLQQFCNRMAAIWQASGSDDPYADQLIMKIYNHIIRVRRYLTKIENEFLEKIKQPEGVVLGIRTSHNPVSYKISFKTPYCYMTAYLLSDFDRVCRVILSAKYAALLTEEEDSDELIREMRKKIRQLLSIPLKWSYSGVTRDDILACNQIAQKAAGLNRFIVEPAMLTGEQRALYAPRIRR